MASDDVGRLLSPVCEMRAGAPSLEAPVNDHHSWRDAPSTGLDHRTRRSAATRAHIAGKQIQLAAFNAAIENGGYIPRADLYALGGYEPKRRLNNGTTPSRVSSPTWSRRLCSPRGRASDRTRYPEAAGYVAARGLGVAPEIVRLKRY